MIFIILQFVLLCGICAAQSVDFDSTGECYPYQIAEQERLYASLLVEELSATKSMFQNLKSISEENSESVIMRDIDDIVARLSTLISTYSSSSWEGLPFLVDAAGWNIYSSDICFEVVLQVFSFREQTTFLEEVLADTGLVYKDIYDCLMSENISECQDYNTPQFLLSVSYDYDTNGSLIDAVAEFRQLYNELFDGTYMSRPYVDTLSMYALWFRAAWLTGVDWGTSVEDQLFKGLMPLLDVFHDINTMFWDIKQDMNSIKYIVGKVYEGDSDVSELLEYTEIVKKRLPQLDELSTFMKETVTEWRTLAQTVRANKPDSITFLSATRSNVKGNELYDLRDGISRCIVEVGELMVLASSQMAESKSAMNYVNDSQMISLVPWVPILQNSYDSCKSIMSYLVCASTTLETSRAISVLYRRESLWAVFDLSSESRVLKASLTNSDDLLPKIRNFLKSRKTNLTTFNAHKESLSNGGQASDSVFTGSAPTTDERSAFQSLSQKLLRNLDSFFDNQCKLHKSVLYSQLIIELQPKHSTAKYDRRQEEPSNYNEIFDNDATVAEAIGTSSITDATLVGLMDASVASLTSRVDDVAIIYDIVTVLIDEAYTAYTTADERSINLIELASSSDGLETIFATPEFDLDIKILPDDVGLVTMEGTALLDGANPAYTTTTYTTRDRSTKLSELTSKQENLDNDITQLESELSSLYTLPIYVGPIAMMQFARSFPVYVVTDVVPDGYSSFPKDAPHSSFVDYEESMDGLFGSLMPDDVLTAVTNLDTVSSYSDNLDGASVFSFTDRNTNMEAYIFTWDRCEFLCTYEIIFRDVAASLAFGLGAIQKNSDEVHLQRGVFVETDPIIAYELRSIISLNIIEKTFKIDFLYNGFEVHYSDVDSTSFRKPMNYYPMAAIKGSASLTIKSLNATPIPPPWTFVGLPLYNEYRIMQKSHVTDKLAYVPKVSPDSTNDEKKWYKLQTSESACISPGVAVTSDSNGSTLLFGIFFDGINAVLNPFLTCHYNPIIQNIRTQDVNDVKTDMPAVTQELYMSYKIKKVTVSGEKKFNIQLEFFSKQMKHVWYLNTIVDHELKPSFIYEKDKLVDLAIDIVLTELVEAPDAPITKQALCQKNPDCGDEGLCDFEKVCFKSGKTCQEAKDCDPHESCLSTEGWKLGRCKATNVFSKIATFVDSVAQSVGRFFSRLFGRH